MFTSNNILEYTPFRDPRSAKVYAKAIKEGAKEDRTIRVMMVGCYGQGKTTLVRRLLGDSTDNVQSTDGIEVHRCKSTEEGSSVSWARGYTLTDEDTIKRLAQIAASTSVAEETVPDKETETAKEDMTLLSRIAVEAALMHRTERHKLSDSQADKPRHIILWDFGGQFIYYTTHQLFHSRNAVYLLVFNLSFSLDKEVKDEDFPGKPNCKTMRDYIIFWMQSIHAFVGSSDGREPAVILVGTHRDELNNDQEADDYFASVRDLFAISQLRYHIHKKSFALSLLKKEDDKIQELRRAILDADRKRNAAITIPARWILLENELKKHTDKDVISFKDLLTADNDLSYPIKDDEQLKLFLQYHHEKGSYFFFDEGDMSKFIVLNPQFVVDAFRCIIRSEKFCKYEDMDLAPLWRELSEKAILKPKLYLRVWENASKKFKQFTDLLVFVLQKHRIISEVRTYSTNTGKGSLQPQGFYVVPSLLKASDGGLLKTFLSGKRSSEVRLVFSFDYVKVVGTVFQRLLSAAIGTWSVRRYKEHLMVFSNVGVFELNLEHAGLIMLTNENIEVYVVNLCKREIVNEMGDYLRRFVEFVIKDEFRKFQTASVQDQTAPSYELKIRCQHIDHGSSGSVNVLQLKKVHEHVGELLGCPDSMNHSLSKRQVNAEWYGGKSTKFPAQRLSDQECSHLSQAIGYEWKTLGIELGLTNVQLQQIDMDNPRTRNKIYEMFLLWKDKAADSATFDVLVEKLCKLPVDSVDWDIVHNLKDGFY